MRLRLLALLTVGAPVAACSGGGASGPPEPAAAGASVALGDSIRVVRGQPVALDGGRLTVSFTDLADSRCPANAMCVWQGDAAVTLRLESGGAVAARTLHTTLEPKRATHAGYEVALQQVEPYPGTVPDGVRVAPVAVLRITRR